VALSDNQDLLVDPVSGQTKPAPAPSWCPEPDFYAQNCPHQLAGLGCLTLEGDPTGDRHMQTIYGLSDGQHGLLVGIHAPGSRWPMLAGADASGKVLWAHELGEHIDPDLTGPPSAAILRGSRGFAVWASGNQPPRVQAFDLTTGSRLWEVAVPDPNKILDEIGVMAVSETRLYLPHSGRLDVLDAETGKELGHAGQNR
jgi:hypothetical protein